MIAVLKFGGTSVATREQRRVAFERVRDARSDGFATVAVVAAIPVLGEKVGIFRFAAVAVGFVGALVIVRPGGLPLDLLMLSPLKWQALVLVPVIGVAAFFIGLRLYERLLRRREPEKTRTA